MRTVRPSLWHRIRSAVFPNAHSPVAYSWVSPALISDALPYFMQGKVVKKNHGQPNTPHIVILTSELGNGHARAAEALRRALKQQCPTARITLLDWWTLLDPELAKLIKEMYLQIVQHHSALYEELYHLDQRTCRDIISGKAVLPASCLRLLTLIGELYQQLSPVASLSGSARQSMDRKVFGLLCSVGTAARVSDELGNNLSNVSGIGTSQIGTAQGRTLAGGSRARLALVKWSWSRLVRRLSWTMGKLQPDAVISTQMIPAALMAAVKRRCAMDIPCIAVPTDFGVHDFWREAETDLYCVGHALLTTLPWLRERNRVSATGFALMPEFMHPITQTEARRELGLPADAQVLLILGGGLGLGVDAVTQSLLKAELGAHLLVLCGRNAPARLQLKQLATQYPGQVHLLDWKDNVVPFMRAADMVIGKPGGMSVAESLACGRPFLAMRSLGGQEGFNVRFIEAFGVGKLLSDDELIQQVRFLLRHPLELELLKTRAASLMPRDGAMRIAGQALNLITANATGSGHGRGHGMAWAMHEERQAELD